MAFAEFSGLGLILGLSIGSAIVYLLALHRLGADDHKRLVKEYHRRRLRYARKYNLLGLLDPYEAHAAIAPGLADYEAEWDPW